MFPPSQASVLYLMAKAEHMALADKSDYIVIELVEKVVVKKGKKWCVYSKDRTRNLGCSTTKGGAIRRLQQVEFFKHQKG